MLKSDWKQGLILLVFMFLMHEVLTVTTMGLVVLGLGLSSFQIKVHRYVRNFFALGVFASYWITYGKIIDPEVGLNFLTSIIVLKILEKEDQRDRYMIFFGLILLISAGSLFERTLTYVFFFGSSFLILLSDFYSGVGRRFRLKEVILGMVWILPLTFLMFFLVPRTLNPIPFHQGKTGPGEMGYTPDVNISDIESLQSNPSPVFQVMVNKALNQSELYWRGNTLSYTDGWNWIQMSQDREAAEELLGARPEAHEVLQKFRLYGKLEYFFTLDTPRTINVGRSFLGLGSTGTLNQRNRNWAPRYEVISAPSRPLEDEVIQKHYLQLPWSKTQKLEVSQMFPGETLTEISESIRRHFISEKYSYSLSPGRSTTFKEFMEKKIGLCSHYASAVALILRAKGFPTRLVSGHMGGNYNRFADFYLITQNDAHVWVEAHKDGKWIRLDPTEWIAPDRVRLGGDAFIESVQESSFIGGKFLRGPRFFQELKMWFGQWDFLFYQWLEEMDYHTQEAFLTKYKFKRQWLFSVIPLIMVIFMGLYSWHLRRKSQNVQIHPVQELWQLFYQKIEKRGLVLSRTSLAESSDKLELYQGPESELIKKIWSELLEISFQNKTHSMVEIKKKIRKL